MKHSLRKPALFEFGQPPVAQLPAGAFLPQLAAKLSRRGKLQRTMGESAGSEYQLTRALPKQLRSALPSIEEIEAELSTPSSAKTAKKAKGRKRA